MKDVKPIEVCTAWYFDCEHCDKGQYIDDTLEQRWLGNRMVYADTVVCQFCSKENFVYREM